MLARITVPVSRIIRSGIKLRMVPTTDGEINTPMNQVAKITMIGAP